MGRFNPDIVTALVATAIGGAMLAVMPTQGGATVGAALGDLQSTAFFPTLASLLMLVLGLLLLFRAVVDRRGDGTFVIEFPRPLQVAGVSLLLIAYLVAIPRLGMMVASMAAILLLGLAIDWRYWKLVIPAAIVVPLGIYYLFERFLRIILPPGTLF